MYALTNTCGVSAEKALRDERQVPLQLTGPQKNPLSIHSFYILVLEEKHMPTYEYECKECGHGFEVFQAMSDQPIKECPECGKEVRRLIFGGTGVIFKGSGFYVTDKGKSGKTASKPAKTPDTAAPSPCASCPAAGGSGESAGCPAAKSGAAGGEAAKTA
jgi:putative FmdB family regulatory protein